MPPGIFAEIDDSYTLVPIDRPEELARRLAAFVAA
jgi:hypothetical protein